MTGYADADRQTEFTVSVQVLLCAGDRLIDAFRHEDDAVTAMTGVAATIWAVDHWKECRAHVEDCERRYRELADKLKEAE